MNDADNHTAMKLPCSRPSANSYIRGARSCPPLRPDPRHLPATPQGLRGAGGLAPLHENEGRGNCHPNPSLGDAHLLHGDEDGSERPVRVTREPPLGQVASVPPRRCPLCRASPQSSQAPSTGRKARRAEPRTRSKSEMEVVSSCFNLTSPIL